MDDSKRGEAEYLIYEVIRQHQRLGLELTKTDFHKRSFLTKKKLEDAGVDIPLPVYWYEHGIMVDLDELLANFFQFERQRYESRTGTKTVLNDDVTRSDFNITENIKERISDVANQIAREYRNVFDTSVAKDETYEEFADNDFIIHLNDLRYHLQDLDGGDTVAKDEYAPTDVSISEVADVSYDTKDSEIDEDTKETLLTYLNNMNETYPDEKYTHMYPLYLEWESLTRQFIYNDMLSELDNFTSDFWNVFSRVELRIHHNENIPKLKIRQWKRKRSEHIDEFENEIERMQKVLLENRESTHELDSVSEAYGESVQDAVRDLRSEQ